MKLVFGTKEQVKFESEADYYFTLGFLAKSDCTELKWEHNEDQGAWGSEGRIHCFGDTANFPSALKNAFTTGKGDMPYRVNCNEYVKHIVDQHKFRMGATQDVVAVSQTVPAHHLDAFNRGLAA